MEFALTVAFVPDHFSGQLASASRGVQITVAVKITQGERMRVDDG